MVFSTDNPNIDIGGIVSAALTGLTVLMYSKMQKLQVDPTDHIMTDSKVQ
jgi:hypothetical protein